jgi:hypothetical protein
MTGYCFQRRNGRSVEYAIPKARLQIKVAKRGGECARMPNTRALAPVPSTKAMPVRMLKSPEARGR